jgi:hypothetical protein
METKILYWPNGKIQSLERSFNGLLHHNKRPAVKKWYESGQLRAVKYYKNGLLHRSKRPACQKWDRNGEIYFVGYYINGLNHRAGKPAIENRGMSTHHDRVAYMQNGKFHREGLPAVYTCNYRGYIEERYINGVRRNTGGPSYVARLYGDVTMELWFDGPDLGWPNSANNYMWGPVRYNITNPDGPAVRIWNATGQIILEIYFVDGMSYRPDGPAYRMWNNDGELLCEAYCTKKGSGGSSGKLFDYHTILGNWAPINIGAGVQAYNEDGPAATRLKNGKLEKYYSLDEWMTFEDWWRAAKAPALTKVIGAIIPVPIAREMCYHLG